MDSLERIFAGKEFEDTSKNKPEVTIITPESVEWYPKNPNNEGAGRFSCLNSPSPLVLLKSKKDHERLSFDEKKEIFNTYWKYYTYVDKEQNTYYVVDKTDSSISFRRNLHLNKLTQPLIKYGWEVWLMRMDYKTGSKTVRNEVDMVGS